MSYLYIFGTILFTVYGQIILKWRINNIGLIINNKNIISICFSYIVFLFDPFIFSGFLSAFVASIFWMFTMKNFELTHAYPFMSLSPSIVLILGVVFLGESLTFGKILGLLLIIVGIIITVRL